MFGFEKHSPRSPFETRRLSLREMWATGRETMARRSSWGTAPARHCTHRRGDSGRICEWSRKIDELCDSLFQENNSKWPLRAGQLLPSTAMPLRREGGGQVPSTTTVITTVTGSLRHVKAISHFPLRQSVFYARAYGKACHRDLLPPPRFLANRCYHF